MNAVEGSYGCEHYDRSVKLIAPCCFKAYYCRFCHDEKETHTLKTRDVTVVQCAQCSYKQRPEKHCRNCGAVFGKYACLICNLFDNKDKMQFHCQDCGICRVGGQENYFHCQKCNLCLNNTIRFTHKCVENASKSDCPICLQYLHTSVNPLRVLDCGHLLHNECYDLLLGNDISVCPMCQTDLSKKLDYAGKPC